MLRALLRPSAAPRSAVLRRCLHATPRVLSGPFKHQDLAINAADTPFEWTEESEAKIAFTLSKCAPPPLRHPPPADASPARRS